MINGENLPNTFFVFSGFLLCVLTYPMLQDERENARKFFIKAVIYRYIRLMPLMTFFLMIDSTWMYHLGSGPFWNKVNFSERQFCRKNWWTNLFFLNNYISGDEKVRKIFKILKIHLILSNIESIGNILSASSTAGSFRLTFILAQLAWFC